MTARADTDAGTADAVGDARTIARSARVASRAISKATSTERGEALRGIAATLRDQTATILEANAIDLSAAEARNLTPAMIDRLRLAPERIAAIAKAVDEVAAAPELVGRIERAETRPNGLQIARMRIPLGVVAIIFESRPNVTVDAAALCIKSGNAAILRGGSEAFYSNQALGHAVAVGLETAGLPSDAVQVLATTDRQLVRELLHCDEDIDVVIPRGGEGLIRFVAETSRIPVLKHYKGVCSVYVHAAADIDMALDICVNAKAQRPGVCNSAETLLIDSAIADDFVPRLIERLAAAGVEIRGDEQVCMLAATKAKPAAAPMAKSIHKPLNSRGFIDADLDTDGETAKEATVVPAGADDWGKEYLALIVAMRIVRGFNEAVAHIEQYGSNHTESIVTQDSAVAERFLREVGSSTVMVNASTRFADGGELGLGAEIGISTTRLHAYGPMGAEGLTTTKFIVRGEGQIRS